MTDQSALTHAVLFTEVTGSARTCWSAAAPCQLGLHSGPLAVYLNSTSYVLHHTGRNQLPEVQRSFSGTNTYSFKTTSCRHMQLLGTAQLLVYYDRDCIVQTPSDTMSQAASGHSIFTASSWESDLEVMITSLTDHNWVVRCVIAFDYRKLANARLDAFISS